MKRKALWVMVVLVVSGIVAFAACSSGGGSNNNGNVQLTGTVQIQGASNQNQ